MIGQKFNSRIIGCPECSKRFKSVTHANIHLKLKHNSKYKIQIVKGAAFPVTRTS